MTKIIKLYDPCLNYRRPALNIRQLLNPIFFSPISRHPDMKRQRCRKQRAKDLIAARRLKKMVVSLDRVDTTIYLVEHDSWLDREVVKPYDLRTMIGGGFHDRHRCGRSCRTAQRQD